MRNLKEINLLFLFFLFSSSISGQEMGNSSYSVFTGGMIVSNSILSTTKIGYEYKHLGLSIDFSHDEYSETWEDNTKSHFQIRVLSIASRYYLRQQGRSFFAELGIGIGNPTLSLKETSHTKKAKEQTPLAEWGLGWRFGKKPKGIFGEIGLRSTTSFKDIHLYTTEAAPDRAEIDNISYQSWLIKKGSFSSQIYVGIGYSF